MTGRSGKILAVSWFVLCVHLLAHSQSEFKVAHALLEKLEADRATMHTTSDRDRLAEELKVIPTKVEGLINQGISDLLNHDASVSPENLQRTIRAALRVGPEQAETGEDAFVFSLGTAKNPSYLVIYNIEYCVTCSLSWIGTFGPEAGLYKLQASLQDPLPNQSLSATRFAISDDVLRLLVYGTQWGDAHSLLNAVAYSFDGHKLEQTWKRTGLPGGTVKIKPGGTMSVSFYTTLDNFHRKQRTEIYALTAEGIHLKSASERPVH